MCVSQRSTLRSCNGIIRSPQPPSFSTQSLLPQLIVRSVLLLLHILVLIQIHRPDIHKIMYPPPRTPRPTDQQRRERRGRRRRSPGWSGYCASCDIGSLSRGRGIGRGGAFDEKPCEVQQDHHGYLDVERYEVYRGEMGYDRRPALDCMGGKASQPKSDAHNKRRVLMMIAVTVTICVNHRNIHEIVTLFKDMDR